MPGAVPTAVLRRWRSLRRDDRGYGIIEMVITIPAMITLVMFVVQFSLIWHARHVAQAAAEEGLRSGRAYQATPADGKNRAEQYLQALAGKLISNPTVGSTPTGNTLTVTVDGTVTSLVPFATFHVHEQATGPIERFVAPGGG
ncbi:MAG: pilus assembly protein [Actinomycetota bacterium]|nr:pilus assembly protein [Actinomycetota bacterium]MDQ2957645.1 pilus assembly protein [Actinomycetota bacterium]